MKREGRELNLIFTEITWQRKGKLKWREPKPFRTHCIEIESRSDNPYRKFARSVFVFVTGMIGWYVSRLNRRSDALELPVVIALALFVGWFLGYGIPWLYCVLPSEVFFADAALCRHVSDHIQYWKYDDIQKFGFRDECFGREAVRILRVTLRNGDIVSLGIASTVAQDAIVETFAEKGVVQ